MKKNILLLFGGVSTEHEVSSVSAAFVADSFDKSKYDVYKMAITREGAWYLYTGTTQTMRENKWQQDTAHLIPAVLSPCSLHHGILVLDKPNQKYNILRMDVAFPVLHGKNGEDGTMQGLLTLAGIPYVGCDTYSSAVCMDKTAAKILCEQEHIRVTPYVKARKTDNYDINATIAESEERFSYPMFVKPSAAGSSVGVTKAHNRAELAAGIVKAFAEDKKILIEQAITGKEIEVAVLGNLSPVVSQCGEIDPGADFYDYETKYESDEAHYYLPARLDEATAASVRAAAVSIYRALDCKGLSRVDFFVTAENDIIFNEINTLPGFTAISLYPRMMQQAGIEASELLDRLVALAEEPEKIIRFD